MDFSTPFRTPATWNFVLLLNLNSCVEKLFCHLFSQPFWVFSFLNVTSRLNNWLLFSIPVAEVVVLAFIWKCSVTSTLVSCFWARVWLLKAKNVLKGRNYICTVLSCRLNSCFSMSKSACLKLNPPVLNWPISYVLLPCDYFILDSPQHPVLN